MKTSFPNCKAFVCFLLWILLALPVIAQPATNDTDERIDEVKHLVSRLREVKQVNETAQWTRYLSKSIDSLRRLREVQDELSELPPRTPAPKRKGLQRLAEKLQQQVDADEEFIAVTNRFLSLLNEGSEEEVEDLVPEINEFLIELEAQRKDSLPAHKDADSSRLESGEYFVSQSWSQEQDFQRPYFVNVPDRPAAAKLPVFVFLHGNGGNARQAMRGFIRNRRGIASQYITVFPQGYRESWNIVSERSKADDCGFIESIVRSLSKRENVDSNNFSIMGSSNGAALVNQLMIECELPNVRHFISGVSPLNEWQHDGKDFHAKGMDNEYRRVVQPPTGKRLLNISGVDDRLVPYRGGPSRAIPAKNGKLSFIDAEESTFVWARHMGYTGKKLTRPTKTDGKLGIFSYLDGNVMHCKVNGEGHGAVHAIPEHLIINFLQPDRSSTK